jgi:nitroreductase
LHLKPFPFEQPARELAIRRFRRVAGAAAARARSGSRASSPGPWIVEDCALAAENLMLTAHAAGLGSCWIGFAQGFLNTPAGKSMAGLPEPWVPVAPIIVGHPKAAPPPVPRNAPEVRWVG